MRRISITAALAAATASIAFAVAASAQVNREVLGDPPVAAAGHAGLAADVMTARLATSKYALGVARAKAAGYRIITRMIPDMGYHFLNAKVSGFDLRRPAILVYERHGKAWQLSALEWVFTSMPATPPLPGARYGVFGAACHYVDGTFVFARAQSQCASKSPQTGAAFSFWHPKLITLHFWIWYPNPAGIYSGTNPLLDGFNAG